MTTELINKFKSDAKNTIGYNESDNKESFLVGFDVAITHLSAYYAQQILMLENSLDMYREMHQDVSNDIKTIITIIKKYDDLDF